MLAAHDFQLMEGTMTEDDAELRQFIEALCEQHSSRPTLTATFLADEAMKQMGFTPETHMIDYHGCHAHLRGLANEILASRFDPVARAKQRLAANDVPMVLRAAAKKLLRQADALKRSHLKSTD
jgi:hypothetical protein